MPLYDKTSRIILRRGSLNDFTSAQENGYINAPGEMATVYDEMELNSLYVGSTVPKPVENPEEELQDGKEQTLSDVQLYPNIAGISFRTELTEFTTPYVNNNTDFHLNTVASNIVLGDSLLDESIIKIILPRNPQSTDVYPVGTIWVNSTDRILFICTESTPLYSLWAVPTDHLSEWTTEMIQVTNVKLFPYTSYVWSTPVTANLNISFYTYNQFKKNRYILNFQCDDTGLYIEFDCNINWLQSNTSLDYSVPNRIQIPVNSSNIIELWTNGNKVYGEWKLFS